MEKKFLVIASFIDKRSGERVSSIVPVNNGVSSKNGANYEIADTDRRETIPGSYAVGTLLSANMSFAVESTSGDHSNTVKLGK